MTMTRWDYSKNLSNYHFDNTINEDNNPHYRVIGRVEGDLAALYEAQWLSKQITSTKQSSGSSVYNGIRSC